MRRRFAAAMLAMVMSAAMIPTAMPVMAQTAAVEASDATAFSTVKFTPGSFSTVTYDGTDKTPSYSVTTNEDIPLTKGTDYTEEWSAGTGTEKKTVTGDLINAGTYTLTLTPTNKTEYTSTATRTFTISKAAVTITPASATYTQNYDGNVKSYPYTISGGNSSDYTEEISYKKGSEAATSAAPTEPGTYAVTITVKIKDAKKANYTQASYTYSGSLVINKINLNNYTVSLSNARYNPTSRQNEITYTGSNVIDAAAVQFEDGSGEPADIPKNDYTISPTTAANIGSYTLTASAKSTSAHYTGSAKPFGFSIVKSTATTGLDFTSGLVTADTIKDKPWTGSPVTLTTSGTNAELKVYYQGAGDKAKKLLTAGTDYTVSYKDNTDVGTATVTVTGAGKYKNTEVPFHFSITKKPLSSSMVTVSPASYAYTGSAIEPTISVRDGSKTLTKGTDYTIEYPDNEGNHMDAGTIRVLIHGAGTKYQGSIQKTFTITPHKLTPAEVELSQTVYTVSGDTNTNIAAQTPNAKISPKVGRISPFVVTGAAPVNGVSITYTNNTKAGNATATIKGSGNYSGTVTKNFTIAVQNPKATALTSSNTVISDIAAQSYSGRQITPGATVKYNGVTLSSGRDYTVTYGTNVEVGSGSVTITGINGFKGSLTKSFTIRPAQISSASVASIPSQSYTGGAITPNLTLTYVGETLREGTDYRVYYSNNINKGTATVRIQGLKNFTGETTRTFSIVEKAEAEKQIWASGFSLPKTLTVIKGSSTHISVTLTPANANASTIRWSTSNSAFPFSDGYTAKTTQNETGVDVKTDTDGSAVITATLYDENSKEIGTQYVLVKTGKRFSDVGSDYYSEAVNTLANFGYTAGSGAAQEWHATPVINGTSDTTFTPYGYVTRAQFVLMLYNKAVADYKAGKTATDPSKAPASSFADVTSYTQAINWAVANGITFGKGSNRFDPNGTVTRAEAVAFLQRYRKGTNENTNKFSDVKSNAYYAGAVGWAVANGVTDGTSATTFSPNQKCSRAQAATFIYRAAF